MSRVFYTLLFVLLSNNCFSDELPPVDSQSDLEVKISGLLKSKLKLNSALGQHGTDKDNLRVYTEFANDGDSSASKVLAITDTFIISRDRKGFVSTQSITISSIADIKINSADELKLFKWINSWNANAFPARVYYDGQNIVVGTNLITSKTNSIDEEDFLSAFVNTVRLWPIVIKELSEQGLVINNSDR